MKEIIMTDEKKQKLINSAVKRMAKLVVLRNKIEGGKYPKSKHAKRLLSHEHLRFIEDGEVVFAYGGD